MRQPEAERRHTNDESRIDTAPFCLLLFADETGTGSGTFAKIGIDLRD